MDRPLSLRHLALGSLVLLAFCLPFEFASAWLTIGPIQFTNVELLSLVTLGLGWLSLLRERPVQWGLPVSWRWLWLALAVAVILTAVLAPDFRVNAFKAAGRTITGLALGFTAAALIRERRQAMWVAVGLLAGGFLAAVAGLLEIGLGRPAYWLSVFRSEPTAAGPFMRLTGAFSHANEAAMYVEATLPLLVALGWIAWQRRQRRWGLLLFLLALLYLQAAFLTYSRSSFATVFLSSLITAFLLWWRRTGYKHRIQALLWSGLALTVLLLVGLNALVSPAFRLRLVSEGDNEWYNAIYIVPEVFSVEAGETIPVSLTLHNDGLLTWSSTTTNPIFLTGRWYRTYDDQQIATATRWSLPAPIEPGQETTFTVTVEAPEWHGDYRLEWDLVQENVVWFSYKNGVTGNSWVVVEDSPTELAESRPSAEEVEGVFTPASPTTTPIPGRGLLWRVAALQLQERPLLGIGLDNFRLTYGRSLGWTSWNDSIHSNNWYIEMLVSLGLLGSLPFFVWMVKLGGDMIQQLRRPEVQTLQVGVAAGLLAYMIHGLLDYFLMFNATGLLFWLLVGLWASQRASKPSLHS